ncbi:ABC transporter ATP-binding protein [Micromonospora sp. NPDC023737]|uniref:ABC transporter ATP-binding protein n=1 Tax=unclassified Micromonospora TaxID=2617518 RepID=UPI0033F05C6B
MIVNAVNVGLRQGATRILHAVDVAVSAGEVVGIIGPNGAGKSTLLRAIAGVVIPDEGEITIAGVDVASARPRLLARQLALVEQHPVMQFDFNVRDYVLLGRHAHLGRFQAEGAVDAAHTAAALAKVGISAFASRNVTTLSGGERQLAAIARALVQQPRALLLDEPTSALDLSHQLRVLELVRDLAAEQLAVIVVVHDLDLAARMCDRLVLLVDGRVSADGPPETVLDADLLRDAYHVHSVVRPSPDTDAQTVTALRHIPTPNNKSE